MPEGGIIYVVMVLIILATAGMIAHCMSLWRKYRIVEADRVCYYNGTKHQVIEIVFDRNDWFMRKVRLHTDSYPYVIDILISDVSAVPKKQTNGKVPSTTAE